MKEVVGVEVLTVTVRVDAALTVPDVLVMVGSDHFHQIWLDNMPQFLIGKAPFYDGNFYNEEREFGLPRMFMPGHEELSAYLLRPETDLPIVPVYTNIFAPPMPQPKRFVELGKMIRRLVESWPSDQRVAIVGTGQS